MSSFLTPDMLAQGADTFLATPNEKTVAQFAANWIEVVKSQSIQEYVELMSCARPGNTQSPELTRFGEFFYSNEHTTLFFQALHTIVFQKDFAGNRGKNNLLREPNSEFNKTLQDMRLEVNSTKRLIDIFTPDFNPIHYSLAQNMLSILSLNANGTLLREVSLFNVEEKQKLSALMVTERFSKTYKNYWREQCASLNILPDMDKFLGDMSVHMKELDTFIAAKQSTEALQKSKELGHFVMEFKARPDISLVLDNSLRAEAYLNSWLLDLNVDNRYRETIAFTIHSHDECHDDRRDVLIGLISGYALLDAKNPYNKNFDPIIPNLSELGLMYPILSEIPHILLEKKIEQEKTLLTQELNLISNQQTINTAAPTKKSQKI